MSTVITQASNKMCIIIRISFLNSMLVVKCDVNRINFDICNAKRDVRLIYFWINLY